MCMHICVYVRMCVYVYVCVCTVHVYECIIAHVLVHLDFFFFYVLFCVLEKYFVLLIGCICLAILFMSDFFFHVCVCTCEYMCLCF